MGCNCRKWDPLDENAIVGTCEDEHGVWRKLIYLTRKEGQKTWSARIRVRGIAEEGGLPPVVDRDTNLTSLRNRVERRACGGR